MFSRERSSNGIIYLSETNNEFEKKYISLRKKEGYLLSPEEIKVLPYVSANKEHWHLRAKSAERFKAYINQKTQPLTVLEIGCGNGWFCNYLSESGNIKEIFGVDINQFELQLAAEAFSSNTKLRWVYADIFTADMAHRSFDMIILNGTVQYFPDLSRLITRLREILNPGGEIHILDSPFYKSEQEQKDARERSATYFSSMQAPDMSNYYTPHLLSELQKFKPQVMHRPSLLEAIKQKLGFSSAAFNPFCWFKISA